MSSDAASDAGSDVASAEQSVHLGLDLPLSADLFTLGLPGLAGLAPLSAGPSAAEPQAPPSEGIEPSADPRPESGVPVAAAAGLVGLDLLLAMAVEGRKADHASEDPEGDGSSDALIPRDPQRLLQWWQQLDQALGQRLLNLSHALNGLLVRTGLSRALLPMALLDAVVHGQMDALPAPANLVRLPLPLPLPADNPMEPSDAVMAVLLRPSDLEFESPPLRTCRQRLERHRRQMRRMAQHHRDWQRRRRSIQAQLLWEKDINGTSPPSNRNV